MSKSKHKEKDVSKWNTTDFHGYLSEITADKFGVTYAPFGRGSASQKWLIEKSQIKSMIAKEGAETTKAFIDYCVENYRPTAQYPFISFGFMSAYRKDDLPRVQAAIAKQQVQAETIKRETEVDDTWF